MGRFSVPAVCVACLFCSDGISSFHLYSLRPSVLVLYVLLSTPCIVALVVRRELTKTMPRGWLLSF